MCYVDIFNIARTQSYRSFVFQIVLACLLALVSSAPAPQPFLIPTVTGAITVAIPALTIPGFGVTVTAASVASALAAKGIVLAGFAKGAALGTLYNNLNSAAGDGSTYAQRFYSRKRI